MTVLERIAPIFAVRDLNEALAYYARLGFDVRAYAGGGYGYAVRDGIEIHLGVVPEASHRTGSASRGRTFGEIACKDMSSADDRPRGAPHPDARGARTL